MEKIKIGINLYSTKEFNNLIYTDYYEIMYRPIKGDLISLNSSFFCYYKLDDSRKKRLKKFGINSKNYLSVVFEVCEIFIFPMDKFGQQSIRCNCVRIK